MWRNMSCGEMFPHGRFLHMSNENCGANLLCREISPHDRSLCFVAIYPVLSQNRFCRNLCAFVWRTNLIKNCACGEKKTNIRYRTLMHNCIHTNSVAHPDIVK